MNTLNKWQHWPAFWNLVREHDVCPESDKERLGKCELCNFDMPPDYESPGFSGLCVWSESGIAGSAMSALYRLKASLAYLDLSTYTPTKTAPLPIVKPCHMCGMEHDEAYPTEACKRLLDAEVKYDLLKEHHIKFLESVDSLQENRPLYKDSGLWQVRTDEMEDVLFQQNTRESFVQFVYRVSNEQQTPPTEEPTQ